MEISLDIVQKWIKIYSISQMVKKPYEFASASGKNVLRIKDMTLNKWALRVDHAHKTGATWDHINVNPKVSGVPDPHTRILTLHGAKAADKTANILQTIGTYAFYGAIAYDAANVMNTALNEGTEKAVKEAGKKAGEYVAAYGGAYMGGMVGAKVGGIAGSIFGPVGIITLGTIGGISGSIYGAIQGTEAAAHFTG